MRGKNEKERRNSAIPQPLRCRTNASENIKKVSEVHFSEDVQIDSSAYHAAKSREYVPADSKYNTEDFALFRERKEQKKEKESAPIIDVPPPKAVNKAKLSKGGKKPSEKKAAAKKEKAATNKKMVKQAAANSAQKSKPKNISAKQRRRRRLTAVLLVVVLLVGGVVLSSQIFLKIEKFTVEGECVYTLQELRDSFGYSVNSPIFAFSSEKTAEKMEKVLPYLQEVKIARKLPGEVIFNVVPAEETYYILQDGQYAVLSAKLKVLRLSQEPVDDLVQMSLPTINSFESGVSISLENKDSAEVLTSLMNHLQDVSKEHVTLVDITDLDSLVFVWEGRVTVLLGGKSDLDLKLEYALRILTSSDPKDYPMDKGSGTFDLSRYPETGKANFQPNNA